MCSKIFGHRMNSSSSFRRRPESSVIYSSNREPHLDSGFRRSDEYFANGLIDTLNTGSNEGVCKFLIFGYVEGASEVDQVNYLS